MAFMKIRKILDEPNFLLEIIEAEPTLHDYGLSRETWRRAVKFLKYYGEREALEMIDQRANRAASRRDFDTARRWRTLITAIHAMQEDEHLPGDNTH